MCYLVVVKQFETKRKMEEKILDEILKYLLNTKFNSFDEIRNDANEKSDFLKEIDNLTFKSALKKLEKDGYVYIVSENKISKIFNNNITEYFYSISFEGVIFLKYGGYVYQQVENQIEKIQLEKLQNNAVHQANEQLSLHRQVVFLTWAIALGTLIAGIYYILEILAFFGVLTSQKN